MHAVFVFWGCYNKTSQAEQLIESRNLVLIVLKAWKSKVKVLADSVSVKGFLVHKWYLLACPHMVEEVNKLFQSSYFITALIPFMQAPSS